MIKTLLLGTLFLIATTAKSATPSAPTDGVTRPVEAAIRAAREEYNAALVSKDTSIISKYWRQDSQSVWADGDLTAGHDNIIARYAKTFQGGRFLWGVRTPEHVDVWAEVSPTPRSRALGSGEFAIQAKSLLGRDATSRCGKRLMACGAFAQISTW